MIREQAHTIKRAFVTSGHAFGLHDVGLSDIIMEPFISALRDPAQVDDFTPVLNEISTGDDRLDSDRGARFAWLSSLV